MYDYFLVHDDVFSGFILHISAIPPPCESVMCVIFICFSPVCERVDQIFRTTRIISCIMEEAGRTSAPVLHRFFLKKKDIISPVTVTIFSLETIFRQIGASRINLTDECA